KTREAYFPLEVRELDHGDKLTAARTNIRKLPRKRNLIRTGSDCNSMHKFVRRQIEHKHRIQRGIQGETVTTLGLYAKRLKTGTGFQPRQNLESREVDNSNTAVLFVRNVKRLAQRRNRNCHRLRTNFQIFNTRELSRIDDRECPVLLVGDKCVRVVVTKSDLVVSRACW